MNPQGMRPIPEMATGPFYCMHTRLTWERSVRPRQIFLMPSCMRVVMPSFPHSRYGRILSSPLLCKGQNRCYKKTQAG